MKNTIYFFTGTGNSLWLAQEIAKNLPECEILAIRSGMDMSVPSGRERVGFVYPTYGWASPLMVAGFFRSAKFPEQNGTYFFTVSTCGGLSINAVPQANALLAERGIRLNYGAKINMFKNSVLNYGMSGNVEKITEQSAKRALPIIHDVIDKRENKIKPVNKFLFRLHLDFMKDVPQTDLGFRVGGGCVSCGMCEKLCPAKNIAMENGKPSFRHKCERCLACIQHCPKQAINYKDITQSRGRYSHPRIKPQDISRYY